MVTVTPSSSYYSRLIKLTVDQGTIVVRKILDERISNVPFHQFLAQEEKEINRLRDKNSITKVQYNVLFPSGGNPPTTADIDFDLALFLLRNLNAFRLNRRRNDPPKPGDTSLEEDLTSLQMFREALDQVSSTTAIDDMEFHQKRSNIELILLNLNDSLRNPIPNLRQCINDLEKWTLFPEEQNRNIEKVSDFSFEHRPEREEDKSFHANLEAGTHSASKKGSTHSTDQTGSDKATQWKQVSDLGMKIRPGREVDKRFDANLDAGTYSASKKGSTHSTYQTGSDKATQWKQDVNAWRMCIERSEKKEAERLICEKILPDQEMLNKASTSFRSDLQVLKIIGDQISSYIKAESNKIINVYAGYKHAGHELVEENALVFAVITTSKIDLENKFGYKLEQICVHKVNSSQEDKDIALMERKYPMNEEDIIKAEKVVAFNSQELVKKHKNITRISVSWIKSSRYGTDDESMDREVCISLYVPKKGLIPIDEKPFPDTLDGFPVDVREGVYIPYSDDNIKIGCKISGHSTRGEFGTLGGFFEKEEKVYGITCAHVFLQNQMFRLGLERNHGTWEAPQTETQDPSNYVYQPSQYKHKGHFGSLVQAVVTPGDGNTSGVDAAVFNIENRHPNSGEFPDANNGRNAGFEETPMLFNSGKLSETVNLNASVVKHGCATDMTRGIVRARASTAILDIHPGWRCTFLKQYEVTTSDNTNFATNGDSGAMVFTVENNELTGIGIVEGGGGSVCFVTPIYDVFRALNMTNPPYEMKRFG